MVSDGSSRGFLLGFFYSAVKSLEVAITILVSVANAVQMYSHTKPTTVT